MLPMLWHVHVVYVRGGQRALTFLGLCTCFGPRSDVGCCVCSWGAKCTDLPGALALALGHIHTSYVVYVHVG